MSSETDSLREIFLDVSEDGTVTERQEEEPSRDPIDADLEAELAGVTQGDGLEDAVDSAFGNSRSDR